MTSWRSFVFIFCLACSLLGSSAFAKIDDSLDIFFPASLKYLQYSQTEFPVFWWNFIVIDAAGAAPDFKTAGEVCQALRAFQGKEIKHLVCGDDLSDYMPLLQDWAQDLVLRESFKPGEYLDRVLQSLAEISFMSSSNKDLFSLKRIDPLDQWKIYLERSQQMSANVLQRQSGFMIEPQSKRIVIPVQFAVMPKMNLVQDVAETLQKFSGVHWVGAHSSAFSNESQVHKDLDIVSIVGIAGLLGFILFLIFKGRVKALLIFPPVAVAMLVSGGIVEMIDGSIHGLTLAFGSGIIGLAVDYGLHGTFNSDSRWTWKSNLIGMLTTLSGLLVLAASGIPLIRQMMIFASMGIIFSFLFFFILCRCLPSLYRFQYLRVPFFDFRGSGFFICILVLFGLWGAAQAHLSFDIRKMNFQRSGDADATNWFFSLGSPRDTFLLLHDQSDFPKIASFEERWSQENKIQYEGIGAYLLDPEQQKENQQSWTSAGCPYFRQKLSSSEAKIFAPFIDGICQGGRVASDFAGVQKKAYLEHLITQRQFLSVFFSKDQTEEKKIRDQFPQAHSLIESVKGFSDSLHADLKWMIPAVFILCSIILGLYYRSILFVIASYIPFFSGMGLFLLVQTLLGNELDIISVLGLLMVFGFSVDYAVFVSDIFAFSQDRGKLDVVYSVLTLAALSNVIGFFPMMFASHPILHQLGVVLVFGTVGTYIGTRWGLEKFLHLASRFRKGDLLK